MRYIGVRVRRIRRQCGMSVLALATQIETTTRYVEMIEAGQRIPSLPTLYRLAEALDVDVTKLLVDEGADKPVMSAAS